MTVAPTANQRLAAITAAGTSIWLDELRRSWIEGDEIANMVQEECLRGMTSNPAIFEKAIMGTGDYDRALVKLAHDGLDTRDLYHRLVTDDVRAACDILRPVWEETRHADGYVSLEVDPDLAFDTDRTLAQAREFWSIVHRPNLMIKIPGTDEGLPAITAAIADGINVNVTLLFSVDQYARVMEAHIQGLERRRAVGMSLDVHSVASFFVSRVDSEVDKRLAELGREDLRGLAGLANARAAYRAFKVIYHGDRFAALRAAGAPVQRPLWASTGVKDKRYPDTLYVDGLLAPETVNTMPLATLRAAGERSSVQGSTADQDPDADLGALAEAGIDLYDVTDQLLREGIEKFIAPMESLLDGIESRRETIVTGRPDTIKGDQLPFEVEPKIGLRVNNAKKQDVARRLWKRNDTLWGKSGQAEVADRLGWLTIVERMLPVAPEIKQFAEQVAADGFTDALLLGMGGSSLAPEVFARSIEASGRSGPLRLHVLDTTDPEAIARIEQRLDPSRTLFIVSTKSGGTIETLSLARYFLARTGGRGERFVAITDPGSSLLDFAAEHGFRHSFEGDPEIGGRYSALSVFGLVPAALAGVDVLELLERAAAVVNECREVDAEQNAGLWLGCALGELALQGCDKLTLIVDEPLSSFGLWLEQLLAESLGKQGKGILPIADEPVGDSREYASDRVFLHLRCGEANDERIGALRDGDHPALTIDLTGPEDLGRAFFLFEFATAIAGWILAVNPFDQPDVARAKAATAEVLRAYEAEGTLPALGDAAPDALGNLLHHVKPGHYVALLGYLTPDQQVDAAVAELRTAIRARTLAATTFGYGPRYLHSTGQLHKGGPPTGHYVLLVHDVDGADRPIPGAAYSFATLKNAQAIGDQRTLQAVGRPVVALRLHGDPAAAIRALAQDV